MKRLAINGRFLTQRVTGVQRHARELLFELDAILADRDDVDVEVLTPSSVRDVANYRKLKVTRVGRTSGQLWEQIELPIHARGRVLLTLSGAAPLAHPRNVWTIHDVAVFATPQAYSVEYRTWYQTMTKLLSRTCSHILTVSEFSKSEIIRYCGTEPSKITVTYPGCGHILKHDADVSVLHKHGLHGTRYILAVGALHSNKNFAGFIAALEYLRDVNVQVVIVGNTNAKVFRRDFEIPSNVKQLGYVTDGKLRALYENAACFVFPSFYEGFGFPPLEAMSLGCPVVAARTASMPEVLRDSAFYCDPTDSEDIGRQIRRALAGLSDRNILMEHARRFSYADCALRTASTLLPLLT